MILVTGATGLVGTHLLIQLVGQQNEVCALYRTKEKRAHTKSLFLLYYSTYFGTTTAESAFATILWKKVALEDILALNNAFEAVTQVYHCAALISFDVTDYKELRETNIKGTANIVNCCIDHQVQKLCYVSSIAALSKIEGLHSIDEQSTWNSEALNSDYAITKYGAELEVWRASQEGVPVVIINPGVIIGPGFYKSGSGRIFSRIAEGLSYYTPGGTGFVGVDDVVCCMIQLMESPIHNENFIVVAENLTFKAFLTKVALALDMKPPNKKAGPILTMLYRLLRWFGYVLFNIKPEISKASAQTLQEIFVYDNSKIKKFLGFEFKSIDQTIEQTAQHFLRK